ncbi:hypothetical protein BVRB_9g218260 [Beta vulgaris subsp. vulgaris]|nr:hypothetical protein BVRB_9g218260 [Beta vulgaris subsp. vulgaris]
MCFPVLEIEGVSRAQFALFRSISSLALILMVLALTNSNMKAAPQFHGGFQHTHSIAFHLEKPEILSSESNESQRNVTFQTIMSSESQVIEDCRDCSCGKMRVRHWLFVVRIVNNIHFFYYFHQPSAISDLTLPSQRPTTPSFTNDFLSILLIFVLDGM